MNPRDMARALGRRGGRVRALRLSVSARKRIASLGGEARRDSIRAARRIVDNFRYAAALRELRRPSGAVKRLRAFDGRLPESIPTEAEMPGPADYLDEVATIVVELRDLGFEPVLVGGMALVVLGSRRVTRDFDFVIDQPGDRLEPLIDVLYDRGLELAARLNGAGDVTSTIGNRTVASVRLRLDAPASAYFFNPRTGLRVDLLFDYPVPAATLVESATRTTVRSHTFHIASEHDLLHLKRIARAQRSSPGDAEDIAFLEARRGAQN